MLHGELPAVQVVVQVVVLVVPVVQVVVLVAAVLPDAAPVERAAALHKEARK